MDDSADFDFPPKAAGKGRRRVFFDDSSAMDDSSIHIEDKKKGLATFGSPRLSSTIVSSDDDDSQDGSAMSVVEDSDSTDVRSNKIGLAFPKSPSIIYADSDKESEHIDVAMKSIASIILDSEDDEKKIDSSSISVLSVVEDSILVVPETPLKDQIGCESADSNSSLQEIGQNDAPENNEPNMKSDNEIAPGPADGLTSKYVRLQEALKFIDKLPDGGARLRLELEAVKKQLDCKGQENAGVTNNTRQPDVKPAANGVGDGPKLDFVAANPSRIDVVPKYPADEDGIKTGNGAGDGDFKMATTSNGAKTGAAGSFNNFPGIKTGIGGIANSAPPVKNPSMSSINTGPSGDGPKVKVEPDYGGAKPKVVLPPPLAKKPNPWEAQRNQAYWNQKYAVNAEHHRLYGGKMTDARQVEAKMVTQEAITKLHKAITLCPAETDETKDPPGLVVPLLEHQRQALTWLLWRESQQPSGGILADDMGLGKTLTMISLILHSKYAKSEDGSGDRYRKKALDSQNLVPSNSNLVVCPASVMHQWEKEIERRVKIGKLSVLVYHGAKRETSAKSLARYDVVLTTYGTLASEVTERKVMGDSSDDDGDSKGAGASKKKTTVGTKYGSPLLGVAWERIILDEAHQVRNHATAQSQAVCKIPAAVRWALTGTPLQNQLKDLFSLMKFLRYAPFDEYAVWKEWIESRRDEDRKRLQTIVKGILLRRTKEMTSKTTGKALVELPPKRFETEILNFTPMERKVYERMFEASRIYVSEFLRSQGDRDNELIKISATPASERLGLRHVELGYKNPFIKTGPKNFKEAEEGGKGAGLAILVMLLRLRQACVHFTLTKDAMDIDSLETLGSENAPGGDLADEFNNLSLLEDEDMEEVAGDSSKQAVAELFKKTALSTKVSAILNRLDHFRNAGGDGPPPKFVLVSQWVQLLDILAIHLDKRKVSYTSITGKVPADERSRRIDQFNNLKGGPQVMLLSITAGGVGVNLVGGNHLFIIDLHWNPALEKQACDRIYRVGQTRDVFIHKFVVEQTIEERVKDLQAKKLELADAVLSGTESKGMNRLTLRDLKYLFGFSSDVNGAGAAAGQSFPRTNSGQRL